MIRHMHGYCWRGLLLALCLLTVTEKFMIAIIRTRFIEYLI